MGSTGGTFQLLVKLIARIEPVLRSNEPPIVTAAAVETAPTTRLDAALRVPTLLQHQCQFSLHFTGWVMAPS